MYLQALPCCAIRVLECVRRDANIRNDAVIQVFGDSPTYKYSKYIVYQVKKNKHKKVRAMNFTILVGAI